MARSAELGSEHTADLAAGQIRYRERGEGPPIVFVHGLLANADLWRKVVPTVADAGYRCIAPDWPLGGHELPMPQADLSPPGVATIIDDFLRALDLRDVTLVANDTGGGITQILMSRLPERVGRVVLTPSDSFERFFPPTIGFLPPLAKVPGSIWVLTQTLRVRATHRLPITFGWVSKRPIPREVVDSYLTPSRRSAAVRDDLRRFLREVHNRHTLAAARELPKFTKPVLLAWATEDKLFPISLADRLAATLPNATLATIDDSYTFVPEDRPEPLARLIVDFATTHAAA
jgi:pimeloyl-ACP methyl ester carboxylesterase